MEYFYFFWSDISTSASDIHSGRICLFITPTITTTILQAPAEKCNCSPIKTNTQMRFK